MEGGSNADAGPPRNLSHLASLVFGVPLLLDDRKAAIISGILVDKINGTPKLSPTAIEDEIYRDDYFGSRIDQSSGICTIYAIGTLVRRKTLLDAASGLVSYSDIKHYINGAISDNRVKGILLQIDSFGGEAGDCFELADYIREKNAEKPIWGSADINAMSAGYALLSSCERCFVAPRGQVGSIAAVIVHMERSKQNEMMGLTYTVIRSLPQKALGTSLEPLPQEAFDKYSASIKKTGRAFADLVSRNRPALGVEAILGLEGQWYDADDARALNLVDDVLTFEQTFEAFASRLESGKPEPPPQRQAPIEPTEEDGMSGANNNPQGGNPNPAATENSPSPPPTPAPTPNANQPAAQAPGTGAVVPIAAAAGAGDAVWNKYITEMRETCEVAGHPEMLGEFLAANIPVHDARKKLIDMRAAAANSAAPNISNTNPGASQPNSANVSLFGNAASLSFDTKTPMTKAQEDAWNAAFERVRPARAAS